MIQLVRASIPVLSRAERSGFEPQLDHLAFYNLISPRTVSVRSLSVTAPFTHGAGQSKVKMSCQLFKLNGKTFFNN